MDHKTYSHAVCRPLNITDVAVTGGFWKRIVDQSRAVGLPAVLTEYENRNIVKNFIDAAAGRPRAKDENAGNYDEFLFKALEACNYYLGQPGTDALRKQYERIRDIVLAAQEPDGYLNTLATQTGTPHHSEETHQELYAGGHLMEAGIAERRSTGKTVLFDAARRYIDCLIDGYGLDGHGLDRHWQAWKWPDHPNVEMALVELYRVTGEKKYLEFCDSVWKHAEYRDRTQMTNHAVCEVLHATGGADYYLETGDRAVWSATQRLWKDMLKKVYVTGAIGSTHRGTTHESVGKEFALTNDQAYAETCAVVSLVFWSWRMFLGTGEPGYIDMLERALYNGVLGGMSVDGREYFYENPLEYRAVWARGSAAIEDQRADFRGNDYRRKAFHNCSCCPPNVQRLLASLQQYIYSAEGRNVWVNLFAGSQATVPIHGGQTVTLRQETDYPCDSRIEISIGLQGGAAAFSLKVRVPAWCSGATIAVNGEVVVRDACGGYAALDRTWSNGDTVTVDLPMPARLVQSHPKNIANYEKLVIARGPIIYCLEAIDNPDVDIFSVVLSLDTAFREHRTGSLGGVVVLEGNALLRDDSDWDRAPYQPFDPRHRPNLTPVRISAIPYYAWANRGKTSMITTLPYVR